MRPTLKTTFVERTLRYPDTLAERATALAKARGFRSLNALVVSLLERELDNKSPCPDCPAREIARMFAPLLAPLLDEPPPSVPEKPHAVPPPSPDSPQLPLGLGG